MKKNINIATSLDETYQNFIKSKCRKFEITFHDIESEGKSFQMCDGIWVTLFPLVDEALINRFPRIKFVASPTTGLTHIDMELLRRENIEVFCLKNQTEFLKTITSTPEFTWGLMLSVWRKINLAANLYRGDSSIRKDFSSRQLKGLTLGIVGYGRVGKILAKYGVAFEMKVVYYDPFIYESFTNNMSEKIEDLSELLNISDVIIVSASAENSIQILNQQNIDFIKKGAVVINTARGVLIDEEALAKKLELGTIFGIGTDVLRKEELQFQDSKISELERLRNRGFNVVITPHIGGMSEDAFLSCCTNILQQIEDYYSLD